MEEAVCITVHLITVPFERLRDSGGLCIILCFKEESVMSFKPLQKSNASATKNQWGDELDGLSGQRDQLNAKLQ